MNIFLQYPLGLLALSSVAVLAVIYILRNKYRKHTVSSLMLWPDHHIAREGGLKISRLNTPLLFFLELLALALLAFAIARPFMLIKGNYISYVFILDDSYSMLAGGDESFRDSAIEEINKELNKNNNFYARFILAGKQPKILGQSSSNISEINDFLKKWLCYSSETNIPKAIELARQISNEYSRIIVMTDHRPDINLERSSIEWVSTGEKVSNLGFIAAKRKKNAEKERFFLEIYNSSETASDTVLKVTGNNRIEPLLTKNINIEPSKTKRIIFELPANNDMITAQIGEDGLGIDNSVFLAPDSLKTIRVGIDVQNEALRENLNKALTPYENVVITNSRMNIIFTDDPNTARYGLNCWVINFPQAKETQALMGPFIIDHSHVLVEGVSCQGVIWSAEKIIETPGTVIMSAGNIPLIIEKNFVNGKHEILFNLAVEKSTVLKDPTWPILIYNILQWREQNMEGLQDCNIKLGMSAQFSIKNIPTEIKLTEPDSQEKRFNMLSQKFTVPADKPGMYEIEENENIYQFASNPLSISETNLKNCTAGNWGQWKEATIASSRFRPIDIFLMLIAILILTWHGYLISTPVKRQNR